LPICRNKNCRPAREGKQGRAEAEEIELNREEKETEEDKRKKLSSFYICYLHNKTLIDMVRQEREEKKEWSRHVI
jgi:hypothetical protein